MRKSMIGLLVAASALLAIPAAQSASWNGANASRTMRTGNESGYRYGAYMARANSGAMMRSGSIDRGRETPAEQDQRRWLDKAVGRGGF
jgi:hypothetical protein